MQNEREVVAWYTVNGKHIPIFADNEPTKAEQKKERDIQQAKEQADILNGKSKKKDIYKKMSGLTFGMLRETDDFYDVDGYSNKKTEKAMLNQLANAIEKIDKSEAENIRDSVKWNEIVQYKGKDAKPGEYILEWEDVPSASRYVDADGVDSLLSKRDDKDDNFDIESAPANYYVHIRMYKHK